MAARAETLYHKVKSNLEARDDVQLAEEVFEYPKDYQYRSLVESITLFVAPNPEVPFDPVELNKFKDRIKIKGELTISMASCWHELRLEDGTATTSLIFPATRYSEKLKSEKDILDPAACMRYLARESRVPDFNQFYSRRDVNVHIFPNWSYANQVGMYKDGLLRRELPDPTMDFLMHDITREQLDELLRQGRHFVLRRLHATPQLAGGRTGK